MLFMNIARRFGHVYQEAAGSEGSAPAAAPAGEPGDQTTREAAAAAAEEAKPKVTLGDAAKQEPAKEEPKQEPAKEAVPEDATGLQEYIDKYSEEKPALGLALGFLRDAGIKVTDPAFQLAEVEGDFSLLEAALALQGKPGTDQMVAILKQEVEAHHQAVEAAEADTTELVQSILGDEHEAVLSWARETASDEEKEAFNNLFEAGGVYARAAATLLKQAYAGTGATIPAKHAVDKTKAAPTGNTALTARDYANEVQALAKRLGGDPRQSPEYAQLSRRRESGRKRGI